MDGQRISFSHALPKQQDLSDSDFLKAIVWSRSAPKTLVRAARDGDVSTFCLQLKKHCFGSARRSNKKSPASNQSSAQQSLWSIRAFAGSDRSSKLADISKSPGKSKQRSAAKAGVARRKSKTGSARKGSRTALVAKVPNHQYTKLLRWLDGIDAGHPLLPVEMLILGEILTRQGRALPANVCFPLWRALLTASIDLSVDLKSFDKDELSADQLLVVQGELPWLAGLLFANINGAFQYGRAGRRFLQEQVCDQTDTDGTPTADLLGRLSFWLAPFVRATQLAKHFRTDFWDDESGNRFQLLVRIITPFCRANGKLALANGSSFDVVELLTSASILAGLNKKSPPLEYLRAIEKAATKKTSTKRSNGRAAGKRKQRPVTQSDWARLACLRNDWSVDADTLLVAHHQETPMVDLTALGQPLISGAWDIQLAVDGKPLDFENRWICSCWFSDEDVDFLELHQSIGSNIRIERQFLLSRTNHFAMFADVVSASPTVRVDYKSRLPLVDQVTCQAGTRTRECMLKFRGLLARTFPLCLPENRVVSCPGSFVVDENHLELTHAAMGGLYAPVFIDWAPEHRRCQAQWRTLTVTEDGRILKSDAASGYRVRIGDLHLLIYRSIRRGETARSVLGHHSPHEMIVGKFDHSGEVESILLVE